MKNSKMILFYIAAIIIVIGVAVLAITLSGNLGAFYLCLGIIAGVVAIIIMKFVNNRKNNKK